MREAFESKDEKKDGTVRAINIDSLSADWRLLFVELFRGV